MRKLLGLGRLPRLITKSPVVQVARATREKELSKPHGLHRTRNHGTEGMQESGGLATTPFMILIEKSSNLEEGSSYNEPHYKTAVNL